MDDTQKKREQRRTRSRGNRWSAEGTDLPKSEVWALAGNRAGQELGLGFLGTYFGCLKAMRHRSYFPTMLQAITRPSALPDRRCHWSKHRHFTAPSWPLSVCKKRCLCFQSVFNSDCDSSKARAGGFSR